MIEESLALFWQGQLYRRPCAIRIDKEQQQAPSCRRAVRVKLMCYRKCIYKKEEKKKKRSSQAAAPPPVLPPYILGRGVLAY